MTPFGTVLKANYNRPKIDQHSLFTSIQISIPALQGTLKVYEPWKRKRMKAKPCYVTLYANDTSPFLVWYKTNNNMDGSSPAISNSLSPDSIPKKPRCVLHLSRAQVNKTTGGSFEIVDFETSAIFRFVAPTVRQSEVWVEMLKGESKREANLDMGSMCSSCSSSSFGSFTPPDSVDSLTFVSPVTSPVDGASKSPAIRVNSSSQTKHSRTKRYTEALQVISENNDRLIRPSQLFLGLNETLNNNDNTHENHSTTDEISPTTYKHTRAQPHLGLNVLTADKYRPSLDNVLTRKRQNSETYCKNAALPLSEYFINLPDS